MDETKKRSYWPLLVVMTAFFLVTMAAVAVADDVANNADATVDSAYETVSLALGGSSQTVDLYIVPQNGDGKQGCNLTGQTTLVIDVASTNTAVATVSPAQITFTSCENEGTNLTTAVTVSPVAVGSANVEFSLVSNGTAGTFDLTTARFTVNVTSATKDATCTIVGYSGVYDGAAHGASGTCKDGDDILGGLDLGGTFTDVPGGTAYWSFSLTGYNTQSGSVDIVIGKAPAGCTISGWSGVYDGDPHGASGSCTGTGTLDLGASYTNYPGGTAHWAFIGNGNYEDASGDVAITIAKADPVCTVMGYSVTYDAAAHTATGSCLGVKGETLSGLDLSGTTHTNAGAYTDTWTFTDATGNYNNASGTVADAIAKADPVCTVIGYSVIFDNSPHTATGSCVGVLGESLSGLDLSETTRIGPAGIYQDDWTFTDVTGNYNDASGTVQDEIIAWTLTGFYKPVDMGWVWNSVKGGSTVPLKFEVFAGTTELTDPGAIKDFRAGEVSCNAVGPAPTDAIEITTTGGTSLRYDPVAGQFIQNWQTSKANAGKCFAVTMTTQDGSTLSALFKIK